MKFEIEINTAADLVDLPKALESNSIEACRTAKANLKRFAKASKQGRYINPESFAYNAYHCPVCDASITQLRGSVSRCKCGTFLSYDWINEHHNLTIETCMYQGQGEHDWCR